MVNSCPFRTGLLKRNLALCLSKWFLPARCWKLEGISFLNTYYGPMGTCSRAQKYISGVFPPTRPPPPADFVLLEAFTIPVSYSALVPVAVLYISCDSLCSPFLGAAVSPVSSLYSRSKDSCLFFSLFSFLFLVRLEWLLPSS